MLDFIVIVAASSLAGLLGGLLACRCGPPGQGVTAIARGALLTGGAMAMALLGVLCLPGWPGILLGAAAVSLATVAVWLLGVRDRRRALMEPLFTCVRCLAVIEGGANHAAAEEAYATLGGIGENALARAVIAYAGAHSSVPAAEARDRFITCRGFYRESPAMYQTASARAAISTAILLQNQKGNSPC